MLDDRATHRLSVAEEETDRFEGLASRARGKIGKVPVGFVVSRAMAVAGEADGPSEVAAVDAIVRRLGSARREKLTAASASGRPRVLGRHVIRGKDRKARPYKTVLNALEPFDGSCDCPDFVRGSLGFCKHLAAVLLHLSRGKRGLEAALAKVRRPRSAALRWDPVRAWTGPGDPLSGIRLVSLAEGRPKLPPRVRALFGEPAGEERRLADVFASDPRRRLRLIDALAAAADEVGALSVDPALGRVLATERTKAERRIEAEKALKRRLGALRSLKRPLYPYQVEGVTRFLRAEHLVLADDMGLGKTAQAIAACHALFRSRAVRRGLVVVPASLRFQWEREWRSFTKVPIGRVDGSPEARAAAYRSDEPGFLLTSYESLRRDLDQVLAWGPDVVVLDEAQRIKNWETRTAAVVKRLEPRYRLALTGTPFENRFEELASILDWVDDAALQPKWRLGSWYSLHDEGGDVYGVKNLATLRARVAPSMLRRRRPEVLRQLPSRTDTAIPVPMTDAQAEEHVALRPLIAKLAHLQRRRPLTQAEFLRLMQLLTTQRVIANGMAQFKFESLWPSLGMVEDPDDDLLDRLASPKLVELREILARLVLDQERKVVVFSQWRRMLRLAHWVTAERLARHGIRATFFSGEERGRRRERNVADFMDDPSVRVLFATDAGGVGLNLQKSASVCINLDLPWNPAVLEQRIARVHRLGQKQPVDVYNLVTMGSIEERIAHILSEKQARFSGLFDGDTDVVRFEGAKSFLGEVLEAFEEDDGVAFEEDDEDPSRVAEAEVDAIALAVSDDLPGERGEASSPAAGPSPAVNRSRGEQDPVGDQALVLLGSLAIDRDASGALRVTAPPETAGALASLFEGLAKALRAEAP